MNFIRPRISSFYVGERIIEVNESDIQYRPIPINRTFENEPVNLDHVIYFFKSENDFRYGIKFHQLIFVTSTKDNNVVWTYETEKDRNEAYQELIKVYCNMVPAEPFI